MGKTDEYKKKIEEARKRSKSRDPHARATEMPSFRDKELEEAGRKAVGPMGPMTQPYKQEEFETLVKEGKAVTGVGAGYPANQAMARGKAGSASDKVRETVEGLNAIAEANKGRLEESPPEEEVEQEPEETSEEGSEEDPAKALDDLPPDVYAGFRARFDERRRREEEKEAVKEKVEGISIKRLLVSQDASQRVPIIPNELEVTFRATNGFEDSWIKETVWSETSAEGSDTFYQTRMALWALVMGVVAINGGPLLEHRTEKGEVSTEKVSKKAQHLFRYPMALLLRLSDHHVWFEERVREALSFESVKNG